MIDGAWLASTLEDTPVKIAGWRRQATQLQHLVTTADVAGHVSDDLLRTAEQTCSSICAEITKCAEVIRTVAASSPQAASQLASLDEALHLVLLEITELTSSLYAVRSRLERQPVRVLSDP